MRLRMLVVFVAILALLTPVSAGQVRTDVPLPANLQGELNGQAYRIRVPANWDGTLLVYSYGYTEGYNLVALTPLGTNTAGADEQMLLDKGYALAGIRAAGSVTVPVPGGMAAAGFNMKERIQSQVALASLFRDMVGRPQWTIAWGVSMGGLVALALIEKYPGLFDGAVPLCPPAAGTTRMFDFKLDIVLACKAAFGWKDEWGTPGTLRHDLNVMTEVFPFIIPQERDWPKAKWAWEFVRMVNHIPDDPSFYQPANFRYQVVWLGFAPMVDMERRAGGRPVQNLDRVYTLTEAEKDYLVSLGKDPTPFLDAMNAERIYEADRNARNYVEHYFDPTGRITRPVLTLHTTKDGAVIPENESAYRELVTDHGNEGLLMQQFSIGNGVANTHCTFTPAQYLAAIDAMAEWLKTGQKPDPAIYFPAGLGFDPAYVPKPWPW